MDELAAYNKERWNALVAAGIEFGRPLLDLDQVSARAWVVDQGRFPQDVMDNLAGKEVLVLAGGGGQQSAALSLLGAQVTVLDLTESQLAGDRLAAEQYGYSVRLEQGDMRDLSRFPPNSFDIVWQPYSINFVPDYAPVFRGVAQVLRPGGHYRLDMDNPFRGNAWEGTWRGDGYAIGKTYEDRSEYVDLDPHWDVTAEDGSQQRVLGPREFQHALGPVLTMLAELGFLLKAVWEYPANGDPSAEPGTWEHFLSVLPPWLWFLFTLGPDRNY
jgi:SAM-dependent methyltransferase